MYTNKEVRDNDEIENMPEKICAVECSRQHLPDLPFRNLILLTLRSKILKVARCQKTPKKITLLMTTDYGKCD